jgi:thymidylate synthase ThyX
MNRQLAKIILDSISPALVRLTTLEVQIPRIVLAEWNTHRVLSRNSASSRAIPIEKMIARVREDPYIPEEWGRNGRGMQAHGVLDANAAGASLGEWLLARDQMVERAEAMLKHGGHKQIINRLLEPFAWHTIIVTATEWDNFDHLRRNAAAHPAIQAVAAAMYAEMQASTPGLLREWEWHTPYIDPERDAGMSDVERIRVSCARCARVSYLTHDGLRDVGADLDLYWKLLDPGHMSPFEHAARPLTQQDVANRLLSYSGVKDIDASEIDVTQHFAGNFRGWHQHRKDIPGEADIIGYRQAAGS